MHQTCIPPHPPGMFAVNHVLYSSQMSQLRDLGHQRRPPAPSTKSLTAKFDHLTMALSDGKILSEMVSERRGTDVIILTDTGSAGSPHSSSWLYPGDHLLADSSPVPSPMWTLGGWYMPKSHNSSHSATAGEHRAGDAHPGGLAGTPAGPGPQRAGGPGPDGPGGAGARGPRGPGGLHARKGGRRHRPRCRYRPYEPMVGQCCLCTVRT